MLILSWKCHHNFGPFDEAQIDWRKLLIVLGQVGTRKYQQNHLALSSEDVHPSPDSVSAVSRMSHLKIVKCVPNSSWTESKGLKIIKTDKSACTSLKFGNLASTGHAFQYSTLLSDSSPGFTSTKDAPMNFKIRPKLTTEKKNESSL